jgi:tRNA-2-methylthio-N6-dimethylallyladenosine synthase
MNVRDSEKLLGLLRELGYSHTTSEKEADLVVYNTCCVRESAENKILGNLGYLKHIKEERPELLIAVCGCMTQQETILEKLSRSYRHVDIVFGTFNLHKLPELLLARLESGGRVVDVWKEHGESAEDLPALREHRFKASVNIMYGCNNFCSYCIVPYVRGRERSRPPADILGEITRLAADGAAEVTLLGQNVNSYRPKSSEAENGITNFAELLRAVDKIDGIERIRFMTSHPKDLSDELLLALAESQHAARHLHLPLQSGSTSVLRAMNRRYTKDDYLRLIERARNILPGIFITTDIITGFPGESEADFLDTLDVVKQARFSGAFTFKYSKRTGTPAASMEAQIPKEIVDERFQRLVELGNSVALEQNRSLIGVTLNVLAEEINGDTLSGRADNNCIVHFKGGAERIGRFTDVKITGCKTFYLTGEQTEAGNDG